MKKFIIAALLVTVLAMALAVPAFAEQAKDTCLVSVSCKVTNPELSANPELSIVQRLKTANLSVERHAEARFLAANPELKIVRRAITVAKAKAAFWAANPEVSTARHAMAAKAASRATEQQAFFLGLRTPS